MGSSSGIAPSGGGTGCGSIRSPTGGWPLTGAGMMTGGPGGTISPFSLNHDPQTIYIGHEPGRTGSTFYGEMDEVTVDPQYGGDCC